MLSPALAVIFIFLACFGASVIGLRLYRWICAQIGGVQIVRVHVDVPVDRSVKNDVDDMVLHDALVGDPEGQVGEY